jgi:serine/threonine protein kinase
VAYRPRAQETPAGAKAHGPGTLLSGRYLLQERIARTEMSSVWRGHDDRLGRAVVIKMMALDLTEQPEARSRFEREARAAAQLSSPHVVTVFDFGTWEDVPYMVIEALTGEDLNQRLRRTPRLPPETCVWIGDHVASALSVAHDAGVVHRDIKPSNLFLCKAPGVEVETLKILDFGVAKLMYESRRTNVGTLIGSPLYMSPEQASGQGVIDTRTDLYSLAVVLYRCLTGDLPFAGTTAEVLLGSLRDPPRPPS